MAGLMGGRVPEEEVVPPDAEAVPAGGGGAPQSQPQQPEGAAPGEDDETPNVDPAEQEVFDQLVSAAVLLIYDEAAKGKTLRAPVANMLAAGDDPAIALGEAAATIWVRVEGQATKDGLEFDEDLREAAQINVFELLATAATEAGVHDFGADDDAFARAFLVAADTMRQNDVQSGRITQEQAEQDMAELQSANETGELDQLLASMGAGPDGSPPAGAPPAPQPGAV